MFDSAADGPEVIVTDGRGSDAIISAAAAGEGHDGFDATRISRVGEREPRPHLRRRRVGARFRRRAAADDGRGPAVAAPRAAAARPARGAMIRPDPVPFLSVSPVTCVDKYVNACRRLAHWALPSERSADRRHSRLAPPLLLPPPAAPPARAPFLAGGAGARAESGLRLSLKW